MSTREQAEEGYSLEDQDRKCRDYADQRGYLVHRIYRDHVSGKDGERPAFQKMVDVASRGGFDVLVVWKRDRFFRDAVEAGFYERILRKWGVRVEDVHRGPLDDSPSTRFTTLIMDGVAELERAFIAERCAMGRLRAAEAGFWPARALYGYRVEAGRLAIDLEQAQKVREAYRECIRGANRARVAQVLGIDPRSASRRLRSPAYKGQAEYAGVVVKCPPIVDEETWQKAQDAMDARFQSSDCYGRTIPKAAPGHGGPRPRLAGRPGNSGSATS